MADQQYIQPTIRPADPFKEALSEAESALLTLASFSENDKDIHIVMRFIAAMVHERKNMLKAIREMREGLAPAWAALEEHTSLIDAVDNALAGDSADVN